MLQAPSSCTVLIQSSGTAVPQAACTPSSTAFASAFGFGSQAPASKHDKQFGPEAGKDPIPEYSLEDDPFAQRYKHVLVLPLPLLALGHSYSALVSAAPGDGRPGFLRSKSDSRQRHKRKHKRDLPALPLTPPTATEGASGSTAARAP